MEAIGSLFWNIVFPVAVTSLFGFFVWWMQRSTKTTPLETLFNEVQEERSELKKDKAKWQEDYEKLQQRAVELETRIWKYLEEIEAFEKLKKNLLARIETLEGEAKAHDKEREKWLLEKNSLMATLNNQNDKIAELTRQYKSVKISTDELKKQTAELRMASDDDKAG